MRYATDGALALSARPEIAPETNPRLRLVPDPGPTCDADLRRRATRLVQALVEIFETDRPVTQLVRWTTPGVYEDLARRLKFVSHRESGQNRLRPRVVSVRVYQPCADAAEVSAHVRHGARSTALALRMESTELGWRCTAISWC